MVRRKQSELFFLNHRRVKFQTFFCIYYLSKIIPDNPLVHFFDQELCANTAPSTTSKNGSSWVELIADSMIFYQDRRPQ